MASQAAHGAGDGALRRRSSGGSSGRHLRDRRVYSLWTFEDIKCRESLPLCTKVLCRRSTAAASPLQQRRPCSSPAHKAQLTTALMAQGWCHESVDIATAQGAVQQLRATVPHRSSVAAAAVSPLQRRRCTKRMWTTGLHSWHKLTGVRSHCHCTRCCAAP